MGVGPCPIISASDVSSGTTNHGVLSYWSILNKREVKGDKILLKYPRGVPRFELFSSDFLRAGRNLPAVTTIACILGWKCAF